MDCFDADVVIYAAAPDHPLGRNVASLFAAAAEGGSPAGAGSVLLLPEVLGKPLRDGAHDQVSVLAGLLARLDLRPVDRATADLATVLSARYRLRAADAVHLATAVAIGADRFITNNHRDFSSAITEVDVTFPDALGSDLP
ncbi:MAG TPA: PIN domain-containing protein [Propionibacteriaceae bacterium]|nr:PIN domain-containing protein [Propionibacteriaceae bacterium]